MRELMLYSKTLTELTNALKTLEENTYTKYINRTVMRMERL